MAKNPCKFSLTRSSFGVGDEIAMTRAFLETYFCLFERDFDVEGFRKSVSFTIYELRHSAVLIVPCDTLFCLER